jgi:hypothetical protein
MDMSDFEEKMRQLNESINKLEAQKQELYNSKYEECIERIKPYVGRCFIQLPQRHRAICVLTMPRKGECKQMVEYDSYICKCIEVDTSCRYFFGVQEKDMDISFLMESKYWEECEPQDLYNLATIAIYHRLHLSDKVKQFYIKEDSNE